MCTQSVADFFQAITDDRTPSPDFEEGLQNQRVLGAVTNSIEQDAWAKVP